jgi:hypothetical protein
MGCCSGATCIPFAAQSETSCGKNGAQCAACTGSQLCRKSGVNPGVCVLPNNPLGAPCTDDTDCGGVDVSNPAGGPAFCLKVETQLLPGATQPTPGMPYSGGYCTRVCYLGNQCGMGAVCAIFGGFWGEALPVCMKSCDPLGGCRSGYACYDDPPFTGAPGCCVPTNLPDGGLQRFDAGPGPSPATLGKDCTTDSDCRGETSYGFCISSRFSDGGMAGYGGGECVADCTMVPDDAWCNGQPLYGPVDGGARCDAITSFIPDGGFGVSWMCKKGCTTSADCKAGYHCTGDGFNNPVCEPNCDNPNASATCPMGCLSSWGCFTDLTCNPTTHDCQ